MDKFDVMKYLKNYPTVYSRKLKNGTIYYIQPSFVLKNGGTSKKKYLQIESKNFDEAQSKVEQTLKKFIQSSEFYKLDSNILIEDNPLLSEFINKWKADEMTQIYKSYISVTEVNLKLQYLSDKIGHYAIKDIEYEILDKFFNHLMNFNVKDDSEREVTLNPSSLNKYFQIYNKVFEYAITTKIFEFNWMRHYQKNRKEHMRKAKSRSNKDAFTITEMQTILAVAKEYDFQFYLIIKFGYVLGMRRSEIAALDMSNSFDFDNNKVIIKQALNTLSKSRYELKETKGKETRVHDIKEEFKIEIMEQIEIRKEFMKKYPPKYYDFEPLFSDYYNSKDGKPFNPKSLTNKWSHFIHNVVNKDTERVRYLSFHCLRHTFATHLLNNYRVEPFVVSKALGHKNFRTTQEYYLHTDDKYIENIGNIL